jgi:flagella basal body P-ring formation protein FlgA
MLLGSSQPLLAADSAAIRQAVDDFLHIQIKSLPGKASYSIGNIDAERLPDACEGFDVAMGSNARPWGKTQVQVSCRGGAWKLWVQVRIRVVTEYLVPARAVNAGQTITEADLRGQLGDLSDLPNGVLVDRALAVGRTAIAPLVVGRPLRADMLRQAVVVQQGQSVKIIGTGSGFEVTNEGRALASAVVGQVIQVRLNSGQILSGLVRADGTVEIRF